MNENLYNSNGLVFWNEEEIKARNMFVDYMASAVKATLLSMNQAFKLVQCEAPILTPYELISKDYDYSKDVFVDDPENLHLAFRPETTMGSYAYARHILSGYHDPKFKLPICVWQHGKSFRREQDQPTKFMRLKEFYQLEFQILFSSNTANDYYPIIIDKIKKSLNNLLETTKDQLSYTCYSLPSDRLPSYSDETTDIVFGTDISNSMEICSISRRKDYSENIKNIEVAIGTDRCVYNFMNK